MNDGYMAPNVPPSPYRRYKSSLAEPTVFNVADTLRVLPFFVSPFALSSRHGAIDEIKSRRFGRFELEPIVC
ncbi:unnamed protein product [Lasius platythorax]|uniref:Uncharacterized protein n=1 Tax=Lasius platythorax TaxID=488582 RepID=A0AAV2P2F3_9HYME